MPVGGKISDKMATLGSDILVKDVVHNFQIMQGGSSLPNTRLQRHWGRVITGPRWEKRAGKFNCLDKKIKHINTINQNYIYA